MKPTRSEPPMTRVDHLSVLWMKGMPPSNSGVQSRRFFVPSTGSKKYVSPSLSRNGTIFLTEILRPMTPSMYSTLSDSWINPAESLAEQGGGLKDVPS